MDMKLELVAVPVSDVDRAKAFCVEKVGFNADHDQRVNDHIRFVQVTPPGSGCWIALGKGIVDSPPGSAVSRSATSRTFPGAAFVFFSDPDGNGWSVEQLPPRN
jgi:hypothetical protein